MTDLRETVARAICRDLYRNDNHGEAELDGDVDFMWSVYLAEADAALAAMRPTIAQARRDALEEAAMVAWMESVSHLHAQDEGEPFAHLEYEVAACIHKAIRALIEKEVK